MVGLLPCSGVHCVLAEQSGSHLVPEQLDNTIRYRRLDLRILAVSRQFLSFAWLFVHYGYFSSTYGGENRIVEFRRFVAAARKGIHWKDAFVQAFSVPMKKIQQEFESHRDAMVHRALADDTYFVIGFDDAQPEFKSVESHNIARRLILLASYSNNDPQLVHDLCDNVLESEPDDQVARFRRFQSAAQLGRFDEAQADWLNLSEVEQALPDGLMTRGVLKHERYRALSKGARLADGMLIIDDARKAYLAALESEPQWLRALVRLGSTYVLEKVTDPTPGVEALTRSLELQPNMPRARLDLAALLIRSGDHGSAKRHLDGVIEAFPKTKYEVEAKRVLRKHY